MSAESPSGRSPLRRRWPIGADERPRNRAALKNADNATFGAWITDSVISWVAAEDDGERVSSFAPLVFSPLEPARQFVAWARGLPVDRRAALEASLSDVLESWDPGKDIRITILLVKLAGHLGCRRGARSLSALLAKQPIVGSHIQVRELAEAVAFFGRQHATPEEARGLAEKLRDANLSAPTAIIALLARAASEFGAAIVEDLNRLVREVLDDTFLHDDPEETRMRADLKRYLANSLVDILGAPMAFKLALQAQERGVPEVREALEFYRLSPLRGIGREFVLRDKLTRLESSAEVGDIRARVLSTPASMAIMDKRVAATSVDLALGLTA